MSNKTFDARNNNKRAKKGISPVIATVILVAVAVVIAAALAGFSSSLFGTYSSAGAAAKVGSISIAASDDKAEISLVNTGNTSDRLLSVQADNGPVDTLGTPLDIPADGIPVSYTSAIALGTFDQGDVVTVKMTMSSGSVLSHSVVVGQ